MRPLHERKSKLTFETGDSIRERGKLRPVIIEAEPGYASIRLKGQRHRIQISWGSIYQYAALYQYAARLAAEQKRREKRKAKEGK